MGTAIWTLWLITYAAQAGSPVVTPLATYQYELDCSIAKGTVLKAIRDAHPNAKPSELPTPGLMICVQGNPIKK